MSKETYKCRKRPKREWDRGRHADTSRDKILKSLCPGAYIIYEKVTMYTNTHIVHVCSCHVTKLNTKH